MATIKDNDTGKKPFCSHPDFDFQISFSQWTQKRSPNTQQIIYENGSNVNVEFHKMLWCDPHSSEVDTTVKKHLVLFVKETNNETPDTFTNSLSINLNALSVGDALRCVVVRYTANETMPNADQIDCSLYNTIADNQSEDGPTVPDTTQGQIIIKR